jgi:Flp pilus assembly protein TadG
MSTLRQRFSAQRAQTLLEFALVAPIVLFLLLLLVDVGIAIDRRLVIDHAVREGARWAAVGGDALTTGAPADEEAIAEHTREHAQGILDDSPVDVCYQDANGNGVVADVGDDVIVDVTHQHDFVTGFTELLDASTGSVNLSTSATARLEYPVEDATACS